jgi:phosphoglucomutase
MTQQASQVYYYTELVHTPLVPFGVSMLKASAGVMVTASHNPAQDNGYKVYWGNGCQIIPPHDKNIAAAIERNLQPICWDEDLVDHAPEGMVETPLDAIRDAYFARVKNMSQPAAAPPPLRFVYTPMHGVGLSAMQRAASDIGVAASDMIVVPTQAQPDPTFPTVRFPNPEERGALDLAISLATENNITLVLASDPDADRFAAAQRLPSGEWRTFTGNELGILFAAHTLENYSGGDVGKLAMLCSTVSSQMLRSMAEREGFHFEETLTGFKWLGSRALELSQQQQGFDTAFAFEEAIGYMFAPVVYDKDGIAAASTFITMARSWQQSPYEKLQELYKKYGYFQSANSYFISKDPQLTRSVFADIRKLRPEMVGKRKVTWWRDLTTGFDSNTSDNRPTLPVDPGSEMITVELEGGVRFTVRGSGTEPKIKSE